MTTRITLISSGATSATRNATFPLNEPLEDKALTQASALAGSLPAVDRIRCSPDLAASQTAAALDLAATADAALREIDFGQWAGKSLAELGTLDPLGLASWVCDPQAVPPDGESVIGFIARIGQWLDTQAGSSDRLLAIAPANCLRAAVLHCLQAPASAFRHIDVAPLSFIFLSVDQGHWRLRLSARR